MSGRLFCARSIMTFLQSLPPGLAPAAPLAGVFFSSWNEVEREGGVQKTYKRSENKLRQHDSFKRPHEIRLICHSAERVLTPQVGIDMDIFDPPITNHI